MAAFKVLAPGRVASAPVATQGRRVQVSRLRVVRPSWEQNGIGDSPIALPRLAGVRWILTHVHPAALATLNSQASASEAADQVIPNAFTGPRDPRQQRQGRVCLPP